MLVLKLAHLACWRGDRLAGRRMSHSRIISNDEGRIVFEEAAPMKRINLGDLTVDKVVQELSALMKAGGP